jgi:hypothetical protein
MEAMLCGALVVGYHGRGGREYFDPAHCFPVEEGDVAGFARTAEEVLGRLRGDPDAFADRTRKARAFVLEHYAPAAEEREVTAFWRRLAAGAPLAPPPAAAP